MDVNPTARRIRLRARAQTMVKGNDLLFLLKNRTYKITPWSAPLRRCLELWREGGSSIDFAERVEADFPGAWGTYASHFRQLEERDFFEDLDAPHNLNPEDVARWGRTLDFLSEFETDAVTRYDLFKRIRDARVMVIGLGGLGSWLTYQLLCLGVGHLRLLDGDRVELANLNRAVLYTPGDVGQWKVDVAVRQARMFAPTTEVEGHIAYLSGPEDLLPHLDGVDLVLGSADQPLWLIRQWITEACLQKGVAVLLNGGGKIGPFMIPGKTACPMCQWTHTVERNPGFADTVARQRELPRGHSGGLAPTAALAAGAMAFETLRYLSGYREPCTYNALWEFDGSMAARVVPLPRHPRCTSCAAYHQPAEAIVPTV